MIRTTFRSGSGPDLARSPSLVSLALERQHMVDQHLAGRGISDLRVLDAFRNVVRESFVPPELVEFAHADFPLPLGDGQTISQPYIVAVTVAALELRGDERVLEIGTGSGYSAAILSHLAKEVFTVERLGALAKQASERLAQLGYWNVQLLHGDGTLGWPEHAPYDAIAVAAASPEIPKALLSQLVCGGRLVIPVGPDESSQVLLQITRLGPNTFSQNAKGNVRFVPLIGEQGWPEEAPGAPNHGPASATPTRARV